MKRVIFLVMDSVGIGGALDADQYGDKGANTLGHILQSEKTKIDNLNKLGIIRALKLSSNSTFGADDLYNNTASYGVAVEKGIGKDTIAGHWEFVRYPLLTNKVKFPNTENTFSADLINEVIKIGNLKGCLGNRHASGVEIIHTLGQEHIDTGKLIIYSSIDDAFQIAAHEDVYPVEKLHELCLKVHDLLEKRYGHARVIARPFVGNAKDGFTRTYNRKDWASVLSDNTMLHDFKNASIDIYAVGKILNIYAGVGMTKAYPGKGISGTWQSTYQAMEDLQSSGLIFTNFVDFDSQYGHRRDIKGYSKALEEFDLGVQKCLDMMKPDDLLIISSDHGNDPSWHGTDHTRENIFILSYSKSLPVKEIGIRNTFADIGATISDYLEVKSKIKEGKSWL